MRGVMQPLRDEHAELLPHIEELRLAGDRITTAAPARPDIEKNLDFLENHLIPHATAEDEVLYPEVARIMGAEHATDTMRRDHVAVSRLLDELRQLRDQVASGPPTDAQARELRRVLYGLYTLVRVHFAKEEEIYVPALEDAMSEEDARGLYHRMEAAAGRARERLKAT